jgi:hypothetical protein
MSSSVACDVCGAAGRRRRGRCAPDGWFFAEVRETDPDGATDDTDSTIVYACTPVCAGRFWKRGPGRLDLVTGSVTGSHNRRGILRRWLRALFIASRHERALAAFEHACADPMVTIDPYALAASVLYDVSIYEVTGELRERAARELFGGTAR